MRIRTDCKPVNSSGKEPRSETSLQPSHLSFLCDSTQSYEWTVTAASDVALRLEDLPPSMEIFWNLGAKAMKNLFHGQARVSVFGQNLAIQDHVSYSECVG